MRNRSRAAIYARISLDAEGTGKGVQRQVEDCRRLASDLGWAVADEYVDNDVSAYTGKRRPEYERMLDDIRSGTVDAVLIYNLDRLTRRPIEFEQFNAIAVEADIPLRCVTGDMDLGTDDGLYVGRCQAAGAAYESGKKSRRQKRKNEEKAAAGQPHGGYRRPFGFEENKVTHKPDEVEIIRTLADRYLAGESLRSLATWLEAEGITTVGGGPWRSNVVRLQLQSPRIAGLREHLGEVVGPAVWEPIITPLKRQQLLAEFERRKVSGSSPNRSYLLTGLIRCSLCKGLLYSARRATTRRYVCQSGPDHGGCGRITVVAAPVEDLIAESVLFRLDTAELADALAGRSRSDSDTNSLMETVSADREHLEALAILHAENNITMSEWMTARKVIAERLQRNERLVRRASQADNLSRVVGQGHALRTQWSSLNLDRQTAIVRAVLDHAVVSPGTRGARALDPARVVPVWRL